VSLLGHTTVLSPITRQNTPGHSINRTSTSSHEMDATSTERQHVSSTPVVGDAHHIASVSSSGRLIKLVGLVDKQPAVVMVDSGSTGDFISQKYVREHKLHQYQYENSNTVWLADGKQHTVSTYIKGRMDIGDMSESIELAVLPLMGHDDCMVAVT
jgi:hypothetical protein